MDNVEKVDVQDALYFFKQHCDERYKNFAPEIKVYNFGESVTVSDGTTTLSPYSQDGNSEIYKIPDYGDWTVCGASQTETVLVDTCKRYSVNLAKRYGVKISKSESSPTSRVVYILDAEGFTPAAVNLSTGAFNYGSWTDVWFIRDNLPLMLKSDGTVDYFLDPEDYSLKTDGTPSDVDNANYDGNAMAQFPLCWVYRYEDDDFLYEIISNVRYDENYKAYAHTDSEGNIKPYFYHALFLGSGSNEKARSIKGQSVVSTFDDAPQCQAAAKANGEGWGIVSWAQSELIRTLLVLIGKSTDSQTSFGLGFTLRDNTKAFPTFDASDFAIPGTLYNKGQFFGLNAIKNQVKVFHIEDFWGNQQHYVAGLLAYDGKVYAKMSPDYQFDSVEGYTDTGISAEAVGVSGNYTSIKQMTASEFGLLSTHNGGTETQYFCDIYTYNNVWQPSPCIKASTGIGNNNLLFGAFSYGLYKPELIWAVGCALTYI